MPIYEYQCEKCNHNFEKLVFSSSDETLECPECGFKKVKKLMSSASIINGGAGCSTGNTSGFS